MKHYCITVHACPTFSSRLNQPLLCSCFLQIRLRFWKPLRNANIYIYTNCGRKDCTLYCSLIYLQWRNGVEFWKSSIKPTINKIIFCVSTVAKYFLTCHCGIKRLKISRPHLSLQAFHNNRLFIACSYNCIFMRSFLN